MILGSKKLREPGQDDDREKEIGVHRGFHLEQIPQISKEIEQISYHQKILDFSFPKISKTFIREKIMYFYEKNLSIFKDQKCSKKIMSITNNRYKKIYNYRLYDYSQIIRIYKDKNIVISNKANNSDSETNNLKKNGANKKDNNSLTLDENEKIYLEQNEVTANINQLCLSYMKFIKFVECLSEITKIEDIADPFSTPTEEVTDGSSLYVQPHFKIKCKLTDTDLLGLIESLSYSSIIVDYQEIVDCEIESLYKRFITFEALKCYDVIDFFGQILNFQCDLSSDKQTLNRGTLFLENEDNKVIEGDFEIIKYYKFKKDTWWLSIWFIFKPDLKQFIKMNQYLIDRKEQELRIKEEKLKKKNKEGQVQKIAGDNGWKEAHVSKIFKSFVEMQQKTIEKKISL